MLSGALGRSSLLPSLLLSFPAEERQRAVECLDRVGLADRTGRRADAHLYVAALYRAFGKTAAARDTLQDALREFGDLPFHLWLLGELLREEGRPGGARLAFVDALALLPPDHDLAAVIEKRIAELDGVR